MSFRACPWLPCVLLALLSCASDPGAGLPRARSAASTLHYRVRFEPGLRVARTRICFEGRPPHQLRPIAGPGPDFIGAVRGPAGRPLPRSGGVVRLGQLTPGSCVSFRSRVSGRRRGDAVLSSQVSWLLRSPRSSRATLELELPPGVHAWLPWGGEGARAVLPASALELAGHVVLGDFERRSFEVRGTRVELVVLPGPLSVDAQACARVVSEAVRTVAQVYGRFPTDALHVVVVPVGPKVDEQDDPIPFGLMRRGGGATAMLLVRADASEADLRDNWVAYHELSHLLLPMLDRRDGWLAEGIPTYYQEVARVRAGLQDERAAWARIVAGLQRGAADACAMARPAALGEMLSAKHVHRGSLGLDVGGCSRESLSGAAEDMHQTGHFYRVYWSGMAFALMADVELRSGAEPTSLDALLRQARPEIRACRGFTSGSLLMRRLDRIAGRQLLWRSYARFGTRRDFPDLSRLFERLGVQILADGSVELEDRAPLSHVRRAIMAPRIALSRP
ncbi:MAG: hypothetical protein GXP55_02290 [Deltaproteobacteria bacterium]|nr:hypothetical protein [Deltaproteobacteria bacterium]